MSDPLAMVLTMGIPAQFPEEWRDIIGIPGYEVSSYGRVLSYRRGYPHVMKPYICKLGYVRVNLGGKGHSVHRLIAAAWHGPCPDGKEVDHINDVRGDNRPENLQYLTRAENMAKIIRRRQNRCDQGHDLSGTNLLVVSTTGERKCRTCQRLRVEQFRAARTLPDDVHGTPNGYINYDCRCAPCKTSNSEYRRQKRQQAA